MIKLRIFILKQYEFLNNSKTLFEAMIHHNLSITYSVAKRSQDCINALKKALRNDEWKESVYYTNSCI